MTPLQNRIPIGRIGSFRRARDIVVFILLTTVIAVATVECKRKGIINIGLGWATHVGPIVLLLNILLCVFAILFSKIAIGRVSSYFIIVTASLFLEYFPVTRNAWAIVGVVLIFLAQCIAFQLSGKYAWKIGAMALCAFINSVFLYNLFQEDQLMTFFKGGWTN